MYWYDGELRQDSAIALSLDDPGLLYGATIFTTLRVYNRALDAPLTHWPAHRQRLQGSLETFGWQPPDWERTERGAIALIPHFEVLRIAVFPDGREWILGRHLPGDLARRQQEGAIAALATSPELRRSLPTHKTGNYLPAWMALRRARQLGANEAILTDAEGNWTETSTGNLWGWKDGGWQTPPIADSALPGVTRSQLLGWLGSGGHSVEESLWLGGDAPRWEAIAYTNSVVEVVPIRAVLLPDSTLWFDVNHPAIAQLRAYFSKPQDFWGW